MWGAPLAPSITHSRYPQYKTEIGSGKPTWLSDDEVKKSWLAVAMLVIFVCLLLVEEALAFIPVGQKGDFEGFSPLPFTSNVLPTEIKTCDKPK